MYLYENSITEDINSLFTNSKVKAVIADSLEECLRRVAAENEDKITLPFVAIVGGSWLLKDTNFYNIMNGTESYNVNVKDLKKNISVIDFEPDYEMYVVAASSRECDMLTRELIFHYYQRPTLTVKIPYGINSLHTFNIELKQNIRKVVVNSGKIIYRIIPFIIKGSYLWHTNTIDILKEIDTTVEEKLIREV